VLGYEVSLRIGVAIQPSILRSEQVWGLGTWQTFGALVAAAKLLKLNQYEILNAFGIAGSNAPVPSVRKTVLNPKGVSMIKNNYGVASWVGVLSALLAKRGFRGPLDILDGPTGFWRMFCSDRCDFNRMTEGLGSKYEILDVSFKPYPACRYIHPIIDAALEALREGDVRPAQISRIIVKTFKLVVSPPYNSCDPQDMYNAQFSVPYCLAVALAGLEPGPSWFDKEILQSSTISRLSKSIEFQVDEEAEKCFPNRLIAEVELVANGKKYSSRVKCPKGDPENPMSVKELHQKFLRLASYAGVRKARKVIRMVNELEEVKDVSIIPHLLY
jgi:2-methylcitrate dehydratase PrpD